MKWKAALLTSALALVVAWLTAWGASMSHEAHFNAERRGLEQAVSSAWAQRAAASQAALSSVQLQALLKSAPHVAYVALRGPKGALRAHAEAESAGIKDESIPEVAAVASGEEKSVGNHTVREWTVEVGGASPGYLQVGFLLAAPTIWGGMTVLLTLLGLLGAGGFAVGAWARWLQPIEALNQGVRRMVAGQLQQTFDVRRAGELGELAEGCQQLGALVKTLLSELREASGDLEKEVTTILSTATRQSAMATQQSSSIHETSATSAEIAVISRQATEFAESVIKTTQRAEELSHEGREVVTQSVAGMSELVQQVQAIALSITDLHDRAQQIGDIINTVKHLAEKSNMVALNASIEAARAGEQGRGFAVVAMEMRNLAEQSKVAAEQVRAILSQVQKGTQTAVVAADEGSKRAGNAIEMAEKAGTTITSMAEAGRESSLAARQIANNSRQQTVGVEQIVTAINEQSRSMIESVASTRQIEQVATSVADLSKRLTTVLSRYRV